MSGDETHSPSRYSGIAIALHWTIAGLIAVNLLGFVYFAHGVSPWARGILSPLHASSGLTILGLTIVRIGWRVTHAPPVHSRAMRRWETVMAQLVHFGLYAAMIFMPLTGWAIVSAHPPSGSAGQRLAQSRAPGTTTHKPPLRFWFVTSFPVIEPIAAIGATPGGVGPQERVHEDFVRWHALGAMLFTTLLVLHVLAALKHDFLDGYPELSRMGLGSRSDS